MNIKNLVGIQPNEIRTVVKTERAIKSDSSHERDANGQQSFQEQKRENHESMSEEQLNKALEHLRNLSAVKEHKWTIQLVAADEKSIRYVVVKDNMGNVIRNIPEYELWTLPVDLEDKKGQLLQKAA